MPTTGRRIGFKGRLEDEPEVRAGFIGCGSHSFRNIYPTFQFAPVKLVATCDLDRDRAESFAAKFGAEAAYTDHRAMLDKGGLDAVFIVTGYDERGRPTYPRLAADCLRAGCHVWIEKPPASSSAEVEEMMRVSAETQRHVQVGLKKMFAPANEKAWALLAGPEFGPVRLGLFQYPQHIPTAPEFARYIEGCEAVASVIGFLDHLCHPMAVLLHLMGMPRTFHYERAASGAGLATLTFPSGAVAGLALTHGAAINGGMERTTLVSENGRHITVENNLRVSYHRNPPIGYGDVPSFYSGTAEQATASWEPEFTLGQLYNKGLFLLGYYGEVNEFARAVLAGRAPSRGTLLDAWQVTRVFEAFAEGPGHTIELPAGPGGA